MGTVAKDPRMFEVGKSAYYVKDKATVCRGKILARDMGATVGGDLSYKLKGASGSIMGSELFATADEAKATIVPQGWWKGNNGH